jgi:hypothetical protein
MRALHRNDRKQIDVATSLGDLIVAESPASPPPTTMIFGLAMKKN